MSWEVLFVRAPQGAKRVDDIPPDFEPEPLGQRDELVALLRERIPGLDFSDPSWGQLLGPDFAIEFSLGTGPVATSLMLHVRGGDEALGVVREVSKVLGCPAFDVGAGEYFDLDDPRAADGLERWRAWRDRVVGAS